MTSPIPSNRDQYLELLAARALGDLSSDEAVALHDMSPQFPDVDEHEMDRVAAVVEMALTPIDTEGMPSSLRDQIQTEASRYISPASDLALGVRASYRSTC